MDKGKLYICPTPIGNLEDITLRVLNTLKAVDVIAAEDTRHTLRLLNHFEIQKPLTSYHEHNRMSKGPQLVNKLLQGEKIALVSDAGMPGISDPGEDLIKLCIEEDIPVEVLPGATAGILALVASGLDARRFSFEGFLDRDKKKKKERLEQIKHEDRTLIFYEAPHRLKETLKSLSEVLGNRQAVVGRELTKKFEEFIRGDFETLLAHFQENPPRGEIVLLCEGGVPSDHQEEAFKDLTIQEHLIQLIEAGMDKKQAIKEVAKARKVPKRDVYQESIELP
ncbi:Uroporphyrin-III C/tetrapyrrole (Corrin/Porphyrin) methyltransferase [Alkaliphilus metalliredigens QYMF]|uniref:Ribosomal RNA small subunit methyltransferase I n=1 Tax=Alkaliphilus metalliredigens (strain QYMF) TaxID=293826 RepID=A6TJG6_ALKMQ|nr:16S rRNA (cytidine(1402)-2'-O)-methyltransferase [Alkaliphilus metalliredigens]ABR46334.1 Uroporphyrin-III C/tetrapyrrole (Corrin/Porphyrin) methyltransferase [Alkaliphilus metalliredigens QYMF]